VVRTRRRRRRADRRPPDPLASGGSRAARSRLAGALRPRPRALFVGGRCARCDRRRTRAPRRASAALTASLSRALHRFRNTALATAILAAAAIALSACGRSNVDLVNGKTLFVDRCGACHTLARANTKGTQGP